MSKAEILPKRSLLIRTACLVGGAGAALLLHHMTAACHDGIETLYAQGIYGALAPLFSRVIGLLPFSLSEILLPATLLALIAALVIGVVKTTRQKHPRPLLSALCHILCVLACYLMAFILFWGLNYNRASLYDTLDLSAEAADKATLTAVALELIGHANALSEEVPRDDDGVFTLTTSARQMTQNAGQGYQALAELSPVFQKTYAAPKCLLSSRILSYTHITGIYLPFTFESNINTNVPDVTLLSSAVHEMAHAYGFAAEEEANFLSYLACSHHSDPSYQYSGAILALIHTMNALYSADYPTWSTLRLLYCPALHRDIQSISLFWDAYEGPVQEVQEQVNDAYLKANHQTAGLQSYSHMIKLLCGWYEKNGTVLVG